MSATLLPNPLKLMQTLNFQTRKIYFQIIDNDDSPPLEGDLDCLVASSPSLQEELLMVREEERCTQDVEQCTRMKSEWKRYRVYNVTITERIHSTRL